MAILKRTTTWQPTKLLGVLLCVLLLLPSAAGAATQSRQSDRTPVTLDALKELLDDAVSAKGCILYDPLEEKVLFSRNAHKQMPPASLTKILTGIVVIENCQNLERTVTIRRNIRIGNGAVTIGLNKGDKVTIRDLLEAAMLHSANDACVALAEAVAGSEKAFLKLMNKTAKKIGARNSRFKNTNGMPCRGHKTTPFDLALIASHAMRNKTFRTIVGYRTAQVKINTSRKSQIARRPVGDFEVAKEPEPGHRIPGKRNVKVRNRHRLVGRYNGITGIKTGYTHAAGRCLATSFISNDREVVTIVLNSRNVERDTLCLLGYQKDVARQRKVQNLARR